MLHEGRRKGRHIAWEVSLLNLEPCHSFCPDWAQASKETPHPRVQERKRELLTCTANNRVVNTITGKHSWTLHLPMFSSAINKQISGVTEMFSLLSFKQDVCDCSSVFAIAWMKDHTGLQRPRALLALVSQQKACHPVPFPRWVAGNNWEHHRCRHAHTRLVYAGVSFAIFLRNCCMNRLTTENGAREKRGNAPRPAS